MLRNSLLLPKRSASSAASHAAAAASALTKAHVVGSTAVPLRTDTIGEAFDQTVCFCGIYSQNRKHPPPPPPGQTVPQPPGRGRARPAAPTACQGPSRPCALRAQRRRRPVVKVSRRLHKVVRPSDLWGAGDARGPVCQRAAPARAPQGRSPWSVAAKHVPLPSGPGNVSSRCPDN